MPTADTVKKTASGMRIPEAVCCFSVIFCAAALYAGG
jgi:hypothetical protein